jgi:hypothetical protein
MDVYLRIEPFLSCPNLAISMLPTLLRIFLGIDMALGLFNYAAWTWLSGQPFNIWFLCLSLFSTHLPDADMIPYLILRKRHRLISHWIFAHHPLLLLPLVALASYAGAKICAPDAVGYTVGLMTTGVFLHFAHDGLHKEGFPWLSPFTFTQLGFHEGKFGAIPQSMIDAWRERTMRWRKQDPQAFEEISSRATRITLPLFLFWMAGLVAVVILIWERGFPRHPI